MHPDLSLSQTCHLIQRQEVSAPKYTQRSREIVGEFKMFAVGVGKEIEKDFLRSIPKEELVDIMYASAIGSRRNRFELLWQVTERIIMYDIQK